MKVKTKKKHMSGVVKVEGSGEIKEVLINADILNPEKRVISICFKGRESSGIVELTENEAEDLGKTLSAQARILKTAKVMKTTKL